MELKEKQVTEVINKTERANSFCGRYAGVNSDFKIYFDSVAELKKGIEDVMTGEKYLAEKLKETEEGYI